MNKWMSGVEAKRIALAIEAGKMLRRIEAPGEGTVRRNPIWMTVRRTTYKRLQAKVAAFPAIMEAAVREARRIAFIDAEKRSHQATDDSTAGGVKG